MTDKDTLRKFLLDDLDEPGRQAVEDLMFDDDEVFQRLSVIDDELIEAYVRGELSTVDSQRLFRRLNASDRGRRTLDFMVQIADRARPKTPPAHDIEKPTTDPAVQSPRSFFEEFGHLWTHFTLAPRAAMAMCGLFLALTVLPWFQMGTMNSKLQSLDAENLSLASEIEALQGADDGAVLSPIQSTFSLRPLVRAEGGEEPRLEVAAATEFLELWLDPGGLVTYAEFRVRLRAQSEDLWQASGLTSSRSEARGLFIPVKIPTTVLSPGRYEVILDGRAEDRFREVARYPIDFERK